MSTIQDVAAHAGVSPATVSRVLMGKNNVTEKTRTVVLQSIKALNYRPNILARQLRQQRTRTVYVIVPDISNPFFYEIYRGIESVASSFDYQTFLLNANNNKILERQYIAALTQKQTDGIISLSAAAAAGVIEQIAEGFPVVIACQYLEDTRLPNVAIDNVSAARDAVCHLIGLGHRKIGMLAGPPNTMLYRDRLNGYFHALSENGIPVNMDSVMFCKSTYQSGYDTVQELLQINPDLTAIFASGDAMAIGAMRAIFKIGKRIPEDIAIIGFDDLDISSFCRPSLSTIRQPMFDIGARSMEMLINLIEGNPTETQVLLGYSLVVRESTDKNA